MANRRWECPRCDRPGVLGPGRMRKDDIRRFCVPCSEDTGRLVARACPALDRQRERKAAIQQEKRQAARVAERETTEHMRYARQVLRKAVGLKAWAREGVKMTPNVLDILDGGADRWTRGRAGWTGWVSVGRGSTRAWTAQVIIHELAHICVHRAGFREAHHGQQFRGVMLSAACEFFGLAERDVLDKWAEIKATKSDRILAYKLDDAVVSLVGMTESEQARAASKGQAHREREAAKLRASTAADKAGWGRAISPKNTIHAHRYPDPNTDEFGCGQKFGEAGPGVDWHFMGHRDDGGFRLTCGKCVQAFDPEASG